jgi:hypothetical protein
MYHLHNSADLGFSFKNRGSLNINIPPDQITTLNDKIKQIPEIQETMTGTPLLPIFSEATRRISEWDGKDGDTQFMQIGYLKISEEYARFH